MNRTSRHSRQFWLAFAAIVGLSWIGGAASACTPKLPGELARTCCKGPIAASCCCELAPAGELRIASDIVSSGVDLSAPSSSCECRGERRSEPASESAPVSPEDRLDRDRDRPEAETLRSWAASTSSWNASPNESPPKMSIFLRTSRLLI